MINEEITILKQDLKMILFWASVGVSQSKGGTYGERRGANDSIGDVLNSCAESINYKLPFGAKFKK